jgi:hypothetical protein
MLLLLALLLSPACLAMPHREPSRAQCTYHHDCTGQGNPLLAHHARVPSLAACWQRCLQDLECRHLTYSRAIQGPYPGSCFLFSGCPARRAVGPGEEWVSASRSCLTPHPLNPQARAQTDFVNRIN